MNSPLICCWKNSAETLTIKVRLVVSQRKGKERLLAFSIPNRLPFTPSATRLNLRRCTAAKLSMAICLDSYSCHLLDMRFSFRRQSRYSFTESSGFLSCPYQLPFTKYLIFRCLQMHQENIFNSFKRRASKKKKSEPNANENSCVLCRKML